MSKRPSVLLRSSWQTVNIGDVAHTPGMLALFEKYFPEAEVIVWASFDFSSEVKEMIARRFPKTTFVMGEVDSNGNADNEELGKAIDRSDFFLHNSGPFLVGVDDIEAYIKRTGKPFGVFGITYDLKGVWERPEDKETLKKAAFVYFRDSVSLEKAKADGLTCDVLEFGPDSAFATDVINAERADAFLKKSGLQEKNFVCCIPRFRYTPYWLLGRAEKDERRFARNEEKKENDHAALRSVIEKLVRETGKQVLVCPEDQTQMAIGKEMIIDKLSPDVLKNVVWREDFWLTDEALGVYVKSLGLFGNEMHSPIMCIGNGIPAIVCRSDEQTSKGFMWRDIGLGDWLMELDGENLFEKLMPQVMGFVTNPLEAGEKAKKAALFVQGKHQEMMQQMRTRLL